MGSQVMSLTDTLKPPISSFGRSHDASGGYTGTCRGPTALDGQLIRRHHLLL
jgi:hypothetical protein